MGRQEGQSLASLDALLREGEAAVRGCGCLELWGCPRLRTPLLRTPLGLSATADALAAPVILLNSCRNKSAVLGLPRLRLRLAGAFPITVVVSKAFLIELSCDLEPKMLQNKSLYVSLHLHKV